MQNYEQMRFLFEEQTKRLSNDEKNIKNLQQSGEALSNQISIFDSKITSNENNIEQNTTNISALTTKVDDVSEVQFDMALGVANLQTRIENAESSLTSLQNQINNLPSTDTTAIENQISEINASLTDINADITALNSSLTEISSSVENISAIEENLTQMTNSVNEMQTSLSELSASLTTLSTNQNTLSSRVDTLESLNFYGETFNFFAKATIPCGRKTYGSNQVYSTIFMLCNTSSLCRIKFKTRVSLSTEATFTPIIQFLHNEYEEIYTKEYNITETSLDDTIEFTYEFFPKQINHNFKIKIKNPNRVFTDLFQVLDTEIEVYGRNIIILNRENNFKVYQTKDYYYLTKNTSPTTAQYKKVYIHDAFDIYSSYTDFPSLISPPTSTTSKTTNIWHYDFTYLPLITYDATTDLYSCSQTEDRLSATNSMNGCVFVVNLSEAPVAHNSGFLYASSNAGHASFSHPGNDDHVMRNTAFTYHYYNNKLGMSMSSHFSGYVTSRVYLNGVQPDRLFVFNTSVFAKDWETNSHRPYYCIGTDEFGQNTFYNGKEATYSVDLGFGTQVNAYMQSDGSINVYMRVINNIHKVVLTLNSETNEYEISSKEDLGIGWEYIEGSYDDYFINKYGEWEYVQPTYLWPTT